MTTPAIKRVNAELKRLGRNERLHRNVRGGSYYYLSGGSVECSIYVYVLDHSAEDYDLAAREINIEFTDAGTLASDDTTPARLPYFSDIVKRDERARNDAEARRELRYRLGLGIGPRMGRRIAR